MKWIANINVIAIAPSGRIPDWENVFKQAMERLTPCIVYLTDLDECSNPNGVTFGSAMDFNGLYREIEETVVVFNKQQRNNQKNLPYLIDLISSYFVRKLLNDCNNADSKYLSYDIIEIITMYSQIFTNKWIQLILNTCCPRKLKQNAKYYGKRVLFNEITVSQVIRMLQWRIETGYYSLTDEEVEKVAALLIDKKLNRYYTINVILNDIQLQSQSVVWSNNFFKEVAYNSKTHYFALSHDYMKKDGMNVLINCGANEVGAQNMGNILGTMQEQDQRRIVIQKICYDVMIQAIEDRTGDIKTDYCKEEYAEFEAQFL